MGLPGGKGSTESTRKYEVLDVQDGTWSDLFGGEHLLAFGTESGERERGSAEHSAPH